MPNQPTDRRKYRRRPCPCRAHTLRSAAVGNRSHIPVRLEAVLRHIHVGLRIRSHSWDQVLVRNTPVAAVVALHTDLGRRPCHPVEATGSLDFDLVRMMAQDMKVEGILDRPLFL